MRADRNALDSRLNLAVLGDCNPNIKYNGQLNGFG